MGHLQVDRKGSEKVLDLQDVVSITLENIAFVLLAAFVPASSISGCDDFVGTYAFQGLSDFIERSPSTFAYFFQGNPALSFSQYEAYGFIEDRYRSWPPGSALHLDCAMTGSRASATTIIWSAAIFRLRARKRSRRPCCEEVAEFSTNVYRVQLCSRASLTALQNAG